MNCPGCGYEISSGIRFCPYCGNAVASVQSRPMSVLNQTAEVNNNNSNSSGVNNINLDFNSEELKLNEKKKKKKKKTIILLTIIILLMAVSIPFLLFYMHKHIWRPKRTIKQAITFLDNDYCEYGGLNGYGIIVKAERLDNCELMTPVYDKNYEYKETFSSYNVNLDNFKLKDSDGVEYPLKMMVPKKDYYVYKDESDYQNGVLTKIRSTAGSHGVNYGYIQLGTSSDGIEIIALIYGYQAKIECDTCKREVTVMDNPEKFYEAMVDTVSWSMKNDLKLKDISEDEIGYENFECIEWD